MMTDPRDIQQILDHLEAALEAICVSRITLQSARRKTPDLAQQDAGAAEDHATAAIASLRRAIEELRALDDTRTSALAHGFVMAAGE
jgi:hypothetical protein